MRPAALLAIVLSLATGSPAAQSHLRIGIADDPDVLDPSLSRTYTGISRLRFLLVFSIVGE